MRTYTLDRGRKFTIQDTYGLNKISSGPTVLDYVTPCKVTEAGPGKLILEGNGFRLNMEYNPKTVTPKIEGRPVTDNGLKRYWSSITRIVFTFNHLKPTGKNEITISKIL